MAVKQINAESFDTEALAGEGKVLVDFYADWCGPCKMMAPTVDDISEENADIRVYKLNVDDAPGIASRYGVMSIPTVIAFENGKALGKIIGVQSKDAVLNLFK